MEDGADFLREGPNMERGHLVDQKAEGGWRSAEGRPESWDSGGSLRSTAVTQPRAGTPNTEKRRLVDQNAAAPPDDRENRRTGPPNTEKRRLVDQNAAAPPERLPGLVAAAAEWPWSSARPHLLGSDDRLVKVAPLLAIAGDWNALLNSGLTEEELRDMRLHSRTGRPLGSTTFVERLERIVGRVLTPKKPGRKRKLPRHPK